MSGSLFLFGGFSKRRYFVRTTGNDGTGNGTNANPWLTIKKALATVPDGATVLVGNGTYTEDSGSGYLNINRVFTNWVTFQPELGALGSVTITNASGTIGTMVNASAAFIRFKYITFLGAATTSAAFRINNTCNKLDFQNCTFTPPDNAAAAFQVYNAVAWNLSNLSLSDCTLNKPTTGAATRGFSLDFAAGTGNSSFVTLTRCNIQAIYTGVYLGKSNGVTLNSCTINSTTEAGIRGYTSPDLVSIINCSVTAVQYAVYVNGCTNWSLTGGSFSNTGAFHCLEFGIDGYTLGVATTVKLTGVTASHPNGVTGHCCIIGQGCVNCVVDGLTVATCNDYALVIKQNTGTEVKNCLLVSGTAAALYCKAAVSPNCHANYLTGASAPAFQVLCDPANGAKCQNVNFQGNMLTATGTGSLLFWGTDATDDLGGGVCDNNFYHDGGSGHFGTVRAAGPGIANLAALQAAWSGYSNPNNDAHSQLY